MIYNLSITPKYIACDMKIDNFIPAELVLTEMGRRLAVIRKQQGLSQDDLASAAGIGVATLRRIEGGNDSQIGTWIKMLRALGMISAVDGLLPQELRSPMAEAKAARKQRGSPKKKSAGSLGIWGDEAP